MQYKCVTVCGIELVPLQSGGYFTEPVFLYIAGKALAKLSEQRALMDGELDKETVDRCINEVQEDVRHYLSEAVLLGNDGKKYRYAMFSEIPEDYDEYV